jgi:hypothetical protein
MAKARNTKPKRTTRKGRKPAAARTAAKVGAARRGGARDSRAIETVLAAFAHDIRTPLTGILALSELLATSGLGEREKRWIAAIKDAAEHLAELTTLVVEGARTPTGRTAARHETFDLPRFAAAPGRPRGAPSQNLACEIIAADHTTGERRRGATAHRARSSGQCSEIHPCWRVGLEWRRRRSRRQAAAHLHGDRQRHRHERRRDQRLFRPFAQANREIAQKFGGSGLGLVQARRLAQAMHGDLTVESAPGRGSTFRLTVMVDLAASCEACVEAVAATKHGDRHGRALNILCVEDNPYGRVVMNAILTELGHRVDFAGSGRVPSRR